MKTIRTAFISCTFLFALGAFAQNPAGGQATQPMQPQPQQSGMQPSQPSQAQPAPDPSAQPGQQQQAAPQAQGSATAGRPSVDDQVQSLSQQLNLSADQQTKVKTALEDQHTQAMNIVQDNSIAREDKMQKIHAIRESTINKVRTTLNDDQKKKFDALVQQQEQHYQQQPQAPQPKQ
jgi:hypothetical protein